MAEPLSRVSSPSQPALADDPAVVHRKLPHAVHAVGVHACSDMRAAAIYVEPAARTDCWAVRRVLFKMGIMPISDAEIVPPYK